MSARRLRVFAASTFIEAVEREFSAAFEVVRAATGKPPLEDLAARVARGEVFDALLLSLDVRLDAPAIAALPDTLRAVATYSVGTDHIDLEAAAARPLVVLNTPGVLGDSVAENAIFLMLGAARRATESIDLLRGGRWTGWTPTQLVGVQLAGRRLGLYGMGDIGLRIADRARALGMEILYHNRRERPAAAVGDARYRRSLGELVEESDVLMIVCPSTDETRRSIDRAVLERARPDLLVVNVARGDIVDDGALIDALRSGRILGAALDVFEGEPDVDPRYFDLPNVFMVPHIGSSTREARLGMGRILIEGLQAWQAGAPIANRVV